MRRSRWKGYYISKSIIKNLLLKEQGKKFFKIWNRNSVIPLGLIGTKVGVHNGKEFKNVLISREMVGYKFGEFASTRKFTKKKVKQKKK